MRIDLVRFGHVGIDFEGGLESSFGGCDLWSIETGALHHQLRPVRESKIEAGILVELLAVVLDRRRVIAIAARNEIVGVGVVVRFISVTAELDDNLVAGAAAFDCERDGIHAGELIELPAELAATRDRHVPDGDDLVPDVKTGMLGAAASIDPQDDAARTFIELVAVSQEPARGRAPEAEDPASHKTVRRAAAGRLGRLSSLG